MYYKIKKDKRTGNWSIKRRQFEYCASLNSEHYSIVPTKCIIELQATYVLQADYAFLVYDGQVYSLYLTSSNESKHPAPFLIMTNISQYRIFYFNEEDFSGKVHKTYVLALKINNFWTFLMPEFFRYCIDDSDVLSKRIENLPKLFVIDWISPAYFKKGFEDTSVLIFYVNGKNYVISPIFDNFTRRRAICQMKITEFVDITLLEPKGYFKTIDEKGEHLFRGSYCFGSYEKIEEFSKADYPNDSHAYHGYWGKDANGHMVAAHIADSNPSYSYHISFENPAKSAHFYNRTYTDTTKKYYYDIWQVITNDGKKQLIQKNNIQNCHNGPYPVPFPDVIVLGEDIWNF